MTSEPYDDTATEARPTERTCAICGGDNNVREQKIYESAVLVCEDCRFESK